jgi:hypothetical protein
MFGDNRQYKKLVAKGKKAPAEVTAATQGHMTTVTQDGALGTTNWTVTVMVQPDHEPAFEATVHRGMLMPVLRWPNQRHRGASDRGPPSVRLRGGRRWRRRTPNT